MSDEDLKNDSELQELLKNTSRGGRERTRRKCTIEKKEETDEGVQDAEAKEGDSSEDKQEPAKEKSSDEKKSEDSEKK